MHGIAFYFAHNTDSFVSDHSTAIDFIKKCENTDQKKAVASMATDDREPRSVMSRGKGDGQVIHGARMVKHRRWTSPHRATWPPLPDEARESELDVPPASKRQKRPRVVKEKSAKAVSSATLMATAIAASSVQCPHADGNNRDCNRGV